MNRLISVIFTIFCGLLTVITGNSQTTNIAVLDSFEITNVRIQIEKNPGVRNLYHTIFTEAEKVLFRSPNPVKVVHYEGLLDNDSKRIETIKSFTDINDVVSLIYASYGSNNEKFALKAKEFVLAWAKTYKPTGNPINENKFNAFYWGYFLFKKHFNIQEQKLVENWLKEIAEKELGRKQTPNNNWEAKRLKIIGIIGCILNDETMKEHALSGFEKYISTSYFPDGTSIDLKTRDALHYHVSGIVPCLSAFINLSKFDSGFDLFNYISESGSSIKKSVEYVVPFAKGEKTRKEWINTTVKLDKERAAAGLEEYQPGILFNPEDAYLMFEWACYFNPDWSSIFENEEEFTSWIGLLNSRLIRK